MQNAKVVEKSGRPSHSLVAKVRGLITVNGIYQYQGRQVNGVRPPRVSLGTRDFNEAVKMALAISQNQDPQYTPGTWSFEIGRYIEERRRLKLSAWTIDSDESALNKFVEFTGSKSRPSTTTTGQVEAWRDELRKDGKKEATVKTYVNRLHGFFAFLKMPKNPCDGVELPVVKVTRADRFCSHEERDLLISLCDKVKAPVNTKRALKDMVLLGFHAGLRLNEMIQMRVEWIQLWGGDGEIRVQETATYRPKGKQARRIPMNSILLKHFQKLQKAGKLTGTYFIRDDVEPGKSKYRWEPRKAFARLLKLAELEWVGWHTLRHTFATQLVIGGCPIASVAKWLGDDIHTTQDTYVGYSPQREHVNAGLTSKSNVKPKTRAKPKPKRKVPIGSKTAAKAS